jgi:CheY-like chemotaxis protein/two-component sensor histidine kinase
LLESSDTDRQQQQWAREVISRQMQRMALMLDDLLEVSRITRGRLDLKLQVVSLDSLVNTAVETARPLFDSKRQNLAVSLPSSINLRVDPLRLSQSISNLLTNAAKYTDTGGHIALRVTLQDDAIVISVKDDGIGLESAVIPHLFQMFSQVDSAIDRAQGGLGIGLALVKGLIELHAGTVEVTSNGIGHGSEFIIRLPSTLLVAEPTVPGGTAKSEPALNPTRRKVLVADDNRDAADTLSLLLEMNGYEVTVAHSGREAFEQLLNHPPDAAILDIGMPDMSGYEVARRFRQESGRRDVFLLAVTGWGQQDDIARAKEAGFDEHLTKPVDPDRVDQLLRKHLAEGRSST